MKMNATTTLLLYLIVATVLPCCHSFAPPTLTTRQTLLSPLTAKDAPTDDEQEVDYRKEVVINSKNPLELASWYAVEAFGKAFGSKKESDSTTSSSDIDLNKPPSSLDETLKRIQLDNDRSYFLSGEVDRYIYDEQCTFADPFVSFDGRDRFIDNLANLGSFITNYDAKMINYNVEKNGEEVVTKVMVKLELNLPWKPVLAWPWGVTYSINPDTYLVTDHIESWDVSASEGVKQIFRPPTVKIRSKSSE
mmetsp:Transcript_22819/g.35286  ORF Transcript_22819/g.35286 Transcript_22819/m.35286 type:complete len:249 (+) Transcript_22819:52-798(+)